MRVAPGTALGRTRATVVVRSAGRQQKRPSPFMTMAAGQRFWLFAAECVNSPWSRGRINGGFERFSWWRWISHSHGGTLWCGVFQWGGGFWHDGKGGNQRTM